MTGQADSPWDGPEGPASWIRTPAVLRTLVVGAGRAGRALARDLRGAEDQELRPIGFLDDAREPFAAREPSGAREPSARHEAQPEPALPLLGTLPELARLVAEHDAEAVVLAIPGLPTARTRELTAAAIGAGAVVRYLPWHAAFLPREATRSDVRPLDIRALIDGPEPHVVSPEVRRSSPASGSWSPAPAAVSEPRSAATCTPSTPASCSSSTATDQPCTDPACTGSVRTCTPRS